MMVDVVLSCWCVAWCCVVVGCVCDLGWLLFVLCGRENMMGYVVLVCGRDDLCCSFCCVYDCV